MTVLLIEHTQYQATVPENKVGVLVTKMSVTDGDEPHSPAWNAKFTIVGGNPGGLFSVETAPGKQEGIIKTVKVRQYIEKWLKENDVNLILLQYILSVKYMYLDLKCRVKMYHFI